MLELKLDDTFKISSDKMNFILEKFDDVMDLKTKESTGEKKWKTVGFFGNKLEYALKAYVIESLRDSEETDVHRLMDRLNELEKQIKKVVKKENIQLIPKGKKEDE